MKVRRRTTTGTKVPNLLKWFRPGVWLEQLAHGHDRRLFVGAFVVFLVVGYAIAATALFPAPFFTESRTVPNVLGLDESEAVSLLQGALLLVGDVETTTHPAIPSGGVVWQDPPAGIIVPQGTSVQLSVSQGPRQIPVPDVANYTGDLARVLLEAAGFVVRIDSVQTAADRGLAVNTRPATGATRRPGDTIRLLVSVGAPTIPVPNLAGMTEGQAQDTLEALGLVMGNFRQATSRAQPPGTIFDQAPPAGTLAAPGTNVTGRVVRQSND